MASLWAVAISYIFFVVNFVGGQVILGRFLLPEDFGTFAVILAYRETVSILLNFSLTTGYINGPDEQGYFDAALVAALILSGAYVMLAWVALLAVGSLSGPLAGWALFALCLAYIPSLMGAVYLAPLEKNFRFKKAFMIRGLTSTLGTVVAVAMAWVDLGVWCLVGREAVSALALFAWAWRASPVRYRAQQTRDHFRPLWSFSLRLYACQGAEVLARRLPTILVGSFFGARNIGLLDRSEYLAGLANRVLGPATNKVNFSLFSAVKHQRDKITAGLKWSNYLLIRLMTPIASGLLLLGRHLPALVYGDEWDGAGEYVQALALFALCLPLTANLKTACQGWHRQGWLTTTFILQGGLVCGLVGLAHFKQSLMLVAAGLSGAELLLVAILLGLFAREGYRISYWAVIIRPIMLHAAALAVGWFAWLGLGVTGFWFLFGAWLTGTIMWLIMIYSCEKKQVREILNMLKRPGQTPQASNR